MGFFGGAWFLCPTGRKGCGRSAAPHTRPDCPTSSTWPPWPTLSKPRLTSSRSKPSTMWRSLPTPTVQRSQTTPRCEAQPKPRGCSTPLPSTRTTSGSSSGRSTRSWFTRARRCPTSRKARNPGMYSAVSSTSSYLSQTTARSPLSGSSSQTTNAAHARASPGLCGSAKKLMSMPPMSRKGRRPSASAAPGRLQLKSSLSSRRPRRLRCSRLHFQQNHHLQSHLGTEGTHMTPSRCIC
mmetsp:Transcript_16938/g.46656  ORF Transcript_16938/g.46656 Transcript_16938/m.46656 type:complete len:238 (+) Transcript_16938:557-1270(+)